MVSLVIDTDPGVDDAHAILLAAAHPDAKIEAITTVNGNVPLRHTTANALKIVQAAGLQVPVYAGCDGPLVERTPKSATHVHGQDGLGDCGILGVSQEPEPEHAALALIRLADEKPGELTLVAIGPLTNLALATRLDPTLPGKYKTLIIMGGAVHARGNTPNLAAEFNIYNDPEAAAVVFSTWPEFYLAPWEAALDNPLTSEQLDALEAIDTSLGAFFRRITAKTILFALDAYGRRQLHVPDSIAVAAAIDPDIVTKAVDGAVHVETAGRTTRGQTVVDWRGVSGKPPNAHIILEYDHQHLFDLLMNSLQSK